MCAPTSSSGDLDASYGPKPSLLTHLLHIFDSVYRSVDSERETPLTMNGISSGKPHQFSQVLRTHVSTSCKRMKQSRGSRYQHQKQPESGLQCRTWDDHPVSFDTEAGPKGRLQA